MLVRHADPARDAAACAAIYRPYVERTAITFDEVAPTAADIEASIAATSERFPWLVLEDDGRVIAYAYAASHRPRAAYRWAADVTVYVDGERHRRGAGRLLYGELLGLLRTQGLRHACAAITLPNEASVGLHRAMGFEQVGTMRAIGYKAGAWRDVGWFQLDLAPGANGSPHEPLAPSYRHP